MSASCRARPREPDINGLLPLRQLLKPLPGRRLPALVRGAELDQQVAHLVEVGGKDLCRVCGSNKGPALLVF